MESKTWNTKLYNVNKMDLLYIFSLLGTISIFIAAILISSKYTTRPKVRLLAFSFYIGACIFLGTWGVLMKTEDGMIQAIQQVFLFFINLRGIYNARRDLKQLNYVKGLKFGEKNRH